MTLYTAGADDRLSAVRADYLENQAPIIFRKYS